MIEVEAFRVVLFQVVQAWFVVVRLVTGGARRDMGRSPLVPHRASQWVAEKQVLGQVTIWVRCH